MQFRFSLRTMLGAALCSTTVAAVACGGRGPLDTDIASYDSPDAAGLTPEGDDTVEPVVDSGTKPVKSLDAGKDGADAAKDSGSSLPGLPDIPGLSNLLGADSGPLGACLSCAQTTCGTQVNACFADLTCVEDGICDLTTCLGGTGTTGTGTTGTGTTGTGTTGTGATGLGGLDLACFQKCGTSATANQELSSALLCVFTSCGTSCLGALTSVGGTGGGGLTGLTGLATPTTR